MPSLLTPLILVGAASLPFALLSPAQEAVQEPERTAAVEEESEAAAAITHQGYLVPRSGHLIMPWPRKYQGGLTILEVASHGSWVEEGQVIARLDLESYERQLRDAELAVEAAERRLAHWHVQHEITQQTADRDLEGAEIRVEQAERKLEGWVDFELEFAAADQQMSAMYREHSIDDATDELEQLEAMYTDDELTDATEEIVLMRSRRNLERSMIAARLSEARAEYQAEFNWERTTMQYERAYEAAVMSLEHQHMRAELAAENSDVEVEALERALEDAAIKLDRLREDREQLIIRSPSRGVVLHGDMHDGARTARHRMGSSLAPRQVAFSVAAPNRFVVRFEVPGEQLRSISDGDSCVVRGALDDRSVAGRVQIEAYPNPSGMFQATVALTDEQQGWVAGSSVSVEFPNAGQ